MIAMKSAVQAEENLLRDRITAAMETGNHGQARTLLREARALYPALAENIRMDVLQEYSVGL
jgi:hypothetical protein